MIQDHGGGVDKVLQAENPITKNMVDISLTNFADDLRKKEIIPTPSRRRGATGVRKRIARGQAKKLAGKCKKPPPN